MIYRSYKDLKSMAKRNHFKAIANGLLSSFISRNNYVYGYWGIGKLYSHMLKTGLSEIKIDLINKQINPHSDEFAILILQYFDRMIKQIINRKLQRNWLKKAIIILTVNSQEIDTLSNKLVELHCKMTLTDDLGKNHSASVEVYCRKHNPKSESKSTRIY